MGLPLRMGSTSITCCGRPPSLWLRRGCEQNFVRVSVHGSPELQERRNHPGKVQRRDTVFGHASERGISSQCRRLRLDEWSFSAAIAGTAKGNRRPIGEGTRRSTGAAPLGIDPSTNEGGGPSVVRPRNQATPELNRCYWPPTFQKHGAKACEPCKEQVRCSSATFGNHHQELLTWARTWAVLAALRRQYDEVSKLARRQIRWNFTQPTAHARQLSRSKTVECCLVKQRPDGERKVSHLRGIVRIAVQGEHLDGQPSCCLIILGLVAP